MKHPRLILCIRVGSVAIAALCLLVVFQRHDFDPQRLSDSAMSLTDSAMSLPVINSVNGYQFELVAPAELTIPQPDKSQQFKMGLKITNNTAHSRYFCLRSANLKMANRDGLPLAEPMIVTEMNPPLNRRDYREIPSGKSVIYEANSSLSVEDGRIALTVFNPDGEVYVYHVPTTGEYRVSFNYSNQTRRWPAEIRGGKVLYGAIDNIWTGNIDTPAKTIKLMNGK